MIKDSEKSPHQACLAKQTAIKELFQNLPADLRYEKIIALGKSLPPLDLVYKTPENLVYGCQSQMYLYASHEDGKLFFKSDSDALISKGMACLLIKIYNGESPETVLTCPPLVLEETGILKSLSPTRANGLQSLYLKMKQYALKFLS